MCVSAARRHTHTPRPLVERNEKALLRERSVPFQERQDYLIENMRLVIGRRVARVGDQAGGRVWLFLETEDFARDHAAFIAAGVRFREQPRREPYGMVAVFDDLYGNAWDLIEPSRTGD